MSVLIGVGDFGIGAILTEAQAASQQAVEASEGVAQVSETVDLKLAEAQIVNSQTIAAQASLNQYLFSPDSIATLRSKGGVVGSRAKLLGYSNPGDKGDADFYWDALSTTPDNGGSVIKPINLNTGRWKRLPGTLSPQAFGARGNGIADDTAAMQAALNECNGTKMNLSIPSGIYKITTPITVQLAIDTTMAAGGRRFAISGESVSNVTLMYTGTDVSNPVLKFRGNYDDFVDVHGINIIKQNFSQTGIGLQLERMARFHVRQIHTMFFEKGTVLMDVNEGLVETLWADWNKIGLYATTSGEENQGVLCNAVHFDSCCFNSNTRYGCWIQAGNSNVFTNPQVLGNGVNDDPTTAGIRYDYGGFNGKVAVIFNGGYFENNANYSIHGKINAGGTHNFTGITFDNVANDQKRAKHHILIEPVDLVINDGVLTVVNMIGNSFAALSGYEPVASRTNVALSPGLNGYNGYQVLDLNYYDSVVEKPVYSSQFIKTPFEVYDASSHAGQLAVTAVNGVLNLTTVKSRIIYIANPPGYLITSITGIPVGKSVMLTADNAIVLQHNSSQYFGGNVNFTFTAGKTITLMKITADAFKETGRMGG